MTAARFWLAARLLIIAACATPVAAHGAEALAPYGGPALSPRELPRLALGPGPDALPVPGEGVSVVHFFATWCEPCRTELPALAAMAARLSGQGVRVVMVDVGEPASRVARFFETAPAAGPVVLDADRALARAWAVDVLPASLVFAAGVPRLSAVGEVAWGDADTDLLALTPSR
ncbi:MAG: TlpA family protein disulfide reductase [Rhizobiales bacterium]|nr:TlpA family protein disulfide reductase [Hyphomicrobiales bacterium]